MWRIEFVSDRFSPYLPEEAQQNPGCYGFELADWLARQLVRQGLVTSYPLGEDWGWFIEFFEGKTEIMIGCRSEASAGDGYTGRAISWRIFVRHRRTMSERLKRAPPSRKVDELARATEAALRGEGIEPSLSQP